MSARHRNAKQFFDLLERLVREKRVPLRNGSPRMIRGSVRLLPHSHTK
jgi:hypothetical protein